MSIEIGSGFRITTVSGFTVTKQIRFFSRENGELAFVRDDKGDVLTTNLNITSDKGGKDILFTCRNGDFVDVYGEKLGELYAKAFRCRKPLLLKMSDGREFRLRMASLWRGLLMLPNSYTLEGENGVEATYACGAGDKSSIECKAGDNPELPAEIILLIGALIALKPLHVSDAKDLSRIKEPEDADDAKDARIFLRISFIFGLLLLAVWLLKCLALLFDKK